MRFPRFILTLMHLVIIILLLATLLNEYIAPSTFRYLNLLSLASPVLMIINIFLCVFWILTLKKRSLLFIGLTFLLFTPIRRWINYTQQSTEAPNLKVLTMNTKSAHLGKKVLYDYLENAEADIIIAQEYGRELRVPGYPHRLEDYQIVALNSKTEIIKHEKLATFSNGNAFYADVRFNGKIVRVINVYLNPFSFDKQMIRPAEDLNKNKTKMKHIVRKLVPTFKIHEREIVDIRRAVDQSPYPVILAGDFNSVPNSYEYFSLNKGLTDVFLKVGRGSATTFHDYKFPIRIDYIFSSDGLQPVSYRVDRSVKLSDHFPVIAEFKID